MEGQERTPHDDDVLVGDAAEGGVQPEPAEAEPMAGPATGSGEHGDAALGADEETGAGISSRDADREEAEPG